MNADFKCSKHGNNGDKDCSECWHVLYLMITQQGGIIIGDTP